MKKREENDKGRKEKADENFGRKLTERYLENEKLLKGSTKRKEGKKR